MTTGFSAFDHPYRLGVFATHPLLHPVVRLPLSHLVAGPCLPPRCFAADTRPGTPSGASNYGF